MRKNNPKKVEKTKKTLLVKKDTILLSVVISISLFLNAFGFGWGVGQLFQRLKQPHVRSLLACAGHGEHQS